jgi:hypothetical protein
MEWLRWAHRATSRQQEAYYMNFWPDVRSVSFYGLPYPIVQVRLIEDPEGPYWGWVYTGKTEVELVQPHKASFWVQFGYSPEVVMSEGKGRIVHLTVEEVSE